MLEASKTVVDQLGEMSTPNPSNLMTLIVLVDGEPQFSLLSYDIKDLRFKESA